MMELPHSSYRLSILSVVIDVADAVLDNLKAHHNWRINRREFHEQASLEIESITATPED